MYGQQNIKIRNAVVMPTRLFCITDVHVSVSFVVCSSNDGYCLSSYHPIIYKAVFLELYIRY